ncbi:MAG: hypothetical protein QGH33_11425 [Pirellulaceae bacterium]|jgi:hypothetical protein|nr:hypothetical protein [Pirellulaceae bacterium]
MATSFGALCTDFHVTHKLALKMDLPSDRETVLHLLDQVRKAQPGMTRFRRYDGELLLESSRREARYRWMALRRTSIRTGHSNPDEMANAYRFHQNILQLMPYQLSISPIDVGYQELWFSFDLECKGNQDEVVFEALLEETPLANVVKWPDAKISDVQPVFGLRLGGRGGLEVYFEVKTRNRRRRHRGPFRNEPIGVVLSVRKYGPIEHIDDLVTNFKNMAHHAERLTTERLVPDLLTPIARQITSSSA